MKKILPVLLLFSMQVFGQTNMYLSADTLDEIPIDGLYYEHEHYLLCKKGVFSFDVNPLLFELEGFSSYLVRFDENLNPLDSVEIPSYEGYLVDAKNLLIQNDTLYVLGRAVKPDISDEQIFLASVNLDLELMHFSLIGSPERKEIITNAILNHHDNILISAKNYVDSVNMHFIAFECDKTGNILQYA